jgi:plasmid stabilization system protein ParE
VTVEFLEEARRELEEAALWYESREPGLGQRFAREVARVVEHIAAHPLLWRERPGGWRRVNCPVFPYYVAFFIRGETIYIAAVAHNHRRPGYWAPRMRP